MLRSGLGPAAIALAILLGAVVAVAGARPRAPSVSSRTFAHKPVGAGRAPTDCRRCHDGRSLAFSGGHGTARQ